MKTMFGNRVMVKLDPENEVIITESGVRLFVDTTFEPEKHVVRVGTVERIPNRLYNADSPWRTEMELQIGDRVYMYFLAIQNCLAPERKMYIREGKEVWIFIKYHNIYCVEREGKIIPINGYVLVEPQEDPAWIAQKEKVKALGLDIPDLRGLSKTDVTYGRIAYLGKPNIAYKDDYKNDNNCDIKEGDVVVMKKIRDIPVEYEYHAKIDGGRKLYRIQRHDILATL